MWRVGVEVATAEEEEGERTELRPEKVRTFPSPDPRPALGPSEGLVPVLWTSTRPVEVAPRGPGLDRQNWLFLAAGWAAAPVVRPGSRIWTPEGRVMLWTLDRTSEVPVLLTAWPRWAPIFMASAGTDRVRG